MKLNVQISSLSHIDLINQNYAVKRKIIAVTPCEYDSYCRPKDPYLNEKNRFVQKDMTSLIMLYFPVLLNGILKTLLLKTKHELLH